MVTFLPLYGIIKHMFGKVDSKEDILRTSKTKLVLTQDEVILLKNSETIKNKEIYGTLSMAIQQYKTVSEKDLMEDILFDDKAKVVLLNNKKMLIDNIKDEWYGIGCSDESTKEIRCQLCSHLNRWVYYIKNRNNGNELHVGSECIKKFKDIENIKQITKDRKEQDRKLALEKRTIEFEQLDIDDINFVKESEEKFKSIDVVLPYELYESIRNSLYNLNYIRTEYIKNGGNIDEVGKRYFELKNRHKELWEEASSFYRKTRKEKLICNKKVGDWIKEKNLEIWTQISKNKGKLSVDTLKYIYEPEFIERHLEDFERCNTDDDIKILRVNGNKIAFRIINSDYFSGLVFEVALDWFMENVGCYCLCDDQYKYTRKNLVKITIPPLQANLLAILNRINYIVEKMGYKLEISEVTTQLYYKRLEKIGKQNKYSRKAVVLQEEGYKKIAKEYIFRDFQQLVFLGDSDIERIYKEKFRLLESRGGWISKKDKEENERLAGEAASMNKQREFIPYV